MFCKKIYFGLFLMISFQGFFAVAAAEEADQQVSQLADDFSGFFDDFLGDDTDAFRRELYDQPSVDGAENDLEEYCFGVTVLKKTRSILDCLESDEDDFGSVEKDGSDIEKEKKIDLMGDEELSDIESDEASTISETPLLKLPNIEKQTPINTTRTVLHATPEDALFTTTLSHDILASILNILGNKGKEARVYVSAFFFTHEALADLLIDLKERYKEAIEIIILIDKMSHHSAKKIIDKIKKTDIPFYEYQSYWDKPINHCKYIAWSYLNEKKERLYRVVSGSLNFTHFASDEHGNFEHMIFKKITEEEFKQYKRQLMAAVRNSIQLNEEDQENQLTNSLLLPNRLSLSPEQKIETYFSPVDDIMKTILDRINNTGLKDKKEEEDEGEITGQEESKICIVSYSLDGTQLFDALMNALKRGVKIHAIVDKYALSRSKAKSAEIEKKLKDLEDAGMILSIYDNGYVLKNHAKLLFIKDGDRILCGQGSYNFTESSQKSFNQFDWVPAKDAQEMYKEWEKKITVLNQKTKSLAIARADAVLAKEKKKISQKKKKEARKKAKEESMKETKGLEESIFHMMTPFPSVPGPSSSSSSILFKK